MNDPTALVAALAVFGLRSLGFRHLGAAALRLGVDSRRSADVDRLGRPTTWI
jgi:hypothetical protein